MPWQDLGLIFPVHGQRPWMSSHGYVPTAFALDDERLRVFASFWDRDSVGRIGFVDVCRRDPTRTLGYSADPVMDVGPIGTFDEHGVTPLAVQDVGRELWMYFAGWQRTPNARYLLFTGLAISEDRGESFQRRSHVPVMDRTDPHYLVRTSFVLREHGLWKAWGAQSDTLIDVNGTLKPSYSLGYMESSDGVRWPPTAEVCLATTGGEVLGYGRSAVWRSRDQYHGLFSVRHIEHGYRIQYSTSPDGRSWRPLRDDGMAFLPSQTTPRQKETMFPSLVESETGRIMFYNGDDFGRAGIRAAEWRD